MVFSSNISEGGIKTFEPALDHPVTQDQIVRFGGQTDTWRFLGIFFVFRGDVVWVVLKKKELSQEVKPTMKRLVP